MYPEYVNLDFDKVTLDRVIYLRHSDDSLAVHDDFLVPLVPGNLGVRGLSLDIKLHRILLHAVDWLQLGGEGVRVGVNLPVIDLNFISVQEPGHMIIVMSSCLCHETDIYISYLASISLMFDPKC